MKFISDPESWEPSRFDGGYTGLSICGLDNFSPSFAYYIIALGILFTAATGESSVDVNYVLLVLLSFIACALYWSVLRIAEFVMNTDAGWSDAPPLLLRLFDLEPRVFITTSLSSDLFMSDLPPCRVLYDYVSPF